MQDNTVVAFLQIGILVVVFLTFLIISLIKKKRIYFILCLSSAVFSVVFSVVCVLSIDKKVIVTVRNEPNDIYISDTLKGGYRYGASILKDEDGKVEAFFSANYESSFIWDVIAYRSSLDNGKTWGEETATLIPIQESDEHYSNCDPGAFKAGEYYYVGYTSTFDARGTYNYIYCARSKTPSNPDSWEKWNGSSWGGNDPKPILEYYGTQTEYGIGEPSFILLNDTVYIYYTYIGTLGNGVNVRQTRVATAPYSENWCKDIQDIGVARNDRGPVEDSMDVKYIPQLKKFIAVTTDNRFTEDSFIRIFMSDDGVAFYETQCESSQARKGLHNIGISGDYNGHLQLDEEQFVIYAYGTGDWGKWDTALSYLEFEVKTIVNFQKLFFKGADDPAGMGENAWGLTSVENQDSEIEKGTFSAANVLKADSSYFWSENYTQARYSTALAIKSGKESFQGVVLKPVETLEGFPTEFHFEYSDDGVIWQRIEGSEVDNFIASEYKAYEFSFRQQVKAKYVRLVAETLGKLGAIDLYALQIEYFSTV